MRTTLITIIACFSFLLPSFGQNTTKKSAHEVWAEFEANPKNIYTFLDALTASDSPQSFRHYIDRFVTTCIKRGIEWDALYDELKETVLPKSEEIATYYAVSLCKNAKDYSTIIKTLDLLPKTHDFDNNSVEDVVIYSDGRIAMKITNSDMQYGCDIFSLAKNSSGPDFFPYPYHKESVTLLYQPSGDLQIGLFKVAGREGFFDVNNSTSDEKLDLFIGFILNRQGVKIGEKYDQYDSFAKLEQKEKHEKELEAAADAKEEKELKAAAVKRDAAIKKRLIAKYGQKAYNAMVNLRPYVGMPEGILREMQLYSRFIGENFLPYGFLKIEGGYRKYCPTYKLQSLIKSCFVTAPKALYVRNGRVEIVKW